MRKGMWISEGAAIAFGILLTLFVCLVVFVVYKNNGAIRQVQESRHAFCVDQNRRHRNTIAALNNEIMLLPPKRRARAEQNKNFTIRLIDALAPIRNCDNF